MNKKFLFGIVALVIPAMLNAQITIDIADLPSAGKQYGVINENPGASVDFSSTGPNHTWDFTSLSNQSTAIDSFLDLSQLPTDFQTYFFGADMADDQSASIGGFNLQGAYTAYNKNGFGFYNRGFAGTIPVLSVTLPFIFIPGDQMVKFPLNYNDADNSSTSAISGVPGVISISRVRTRSNTVDGWGTLQLPSGIYQVLRLKADIADHDSVHIELTGTDQILDALTHEYNWYAPGKGIPVLQIKTNDMGGNETVTQITYQDPSLLPNSIQNIPSENSFQLYPNPASDFAFVLPSEKFHNEKMLITDVAGKVLSEIPVSNSTTTSIDLTHLSEGIYFVQFLNDGKSESVQKLIVNR